jgi:hypothetical protein
MKAYVGMGIVLMHSPEKVNVPQLMSSWSCKIVMTGCRVGVNGWASGITGGLLGGGGWCMSVLPACHPISVCAVFVSRLPHDLPRRLPGFAVPNTVTVTWFRICLNTPQGANEADGVNTVPVTVLQSFKPPACLKYCSTMFVLAAPLSVLCAVILPLLCRSNLMLTTC